MNFISREKKKHLSFQHFSFICLFVNVLFLSLFIRLIGLHNEKSKCFWILPMNMDEAINPSAVSDFNVHFL